MVVTSEALWPGSVLVRVRKGKRVSWEKRNVFSLDLKTVIESLSITVFGSEFEIAGAVQRKARFTNVVLNDGWDSDVVADCRLWTCINWAVCKYAPRPRQITMPAPHHSVYDRLDTLPATQPTASKHWMHRQWVSEYFFWYSLAWVVLDKR